MFKQGIDLSCDVFLSLNFRFRKAGLIWKTSMDKSFTNIFDSIEDSDASFDSNQEMEILDLFNSEFPRAALFAGLDGGTPYLLNERCIFERANQFPKLQMPFVDLFPMAY